MKRNNIILLLLLLLMAIGWGIVYWIFFADQVDGAVAFLSVQTPAAQLFGS